MRYPLFLRIWLGLAVFAVFLTPQASFAYEPEVHAGLTQEAIFFYNQFFPKKTIKSSELALILTGSRDEDTIPRMLNHYFDPISDTGLHYFFTTWESSKVWAKDSRNQKSLLYRPTGIFDKLADILGKEKAEDTDFTWDRAIKDYVSGNKDRAFVGLGHILHLIEDLAVPAHTRDDPHPPFVGLDPDGGGEDSYERYTAKYILEKINVLQSLRIGKKEPVILNSLDKYFNELAIYTNTHFYSQDSILNSIYDLPNPDETIERAGKPYQKGEDVDGTFPLALVNTDLFDKNIVNLKVSSDFVNQEYWGRLSQKAVQYGAGVINLFFREVEAERARIEGDGSAQVLNSFDLTVEPGFDFGIVSLKMEAPEAPILNEVSSLENNDDLEAQVAMAQDLVDSLSVQISEIESSRQALEESVSATEQVAPVQYNMIVGGGGGVSSAPGTMVPLESADLQVNPDSNGMEKESSEDQGDLDLPIQPEDDNAEPESEVNEAEEVEVEPEPVVDTKLPGTITTLSISNVGTSTLTLVWMAMGDDNDLGRATGYDIRFSLEEITLDNWDEAQILENGLEPAESYEREEFLATGLEQDVEYYFAIKSIDEAGNFSDISNNASWRTLFIPAKILISEVFVDMEGVDNMEFIELYNPNDEAVDLEKWSVQYASGSANEFSDIKKKNFEEQAVIEPKSFYLVGLKDFEGESDMTWSQSLNNTGGVVWLVASHEKLEIDYETLIVDRLDYGEGEGSILDSDLAVELPESGQSLERQAMVDGVCVVGMEGEVEFSGNACDVGVKDDFMVRKVPTPQGRINFPEPREKPTTPILAGDYREEDGIIDLSWSESVDWRGESVVSYGLSDGEIELLRGEDREFSKKILEINRDYAFEVRAFDNEGFGSDTAVVEISVPSYLNTLRWYFDSASSTEDGSVYRLEMVWEEYPFVPVRVPHSALGKIDGWHIAVFSYNSEPTQIPTMGEWIESYYWGMAINMPNPFWVSYQSCKGSVTKASGVIFADTPEQCSYLISAPKGSALSKEYYGDGGISLIVRSNTFGDIEPGPDDYITVSYYAFDPGANFNSNQRLVAIDSHRYYLESVE